MASADASTVRVVSYNILNGGEERLELIGETIERLGADVVGFQEANEPEHIARLADRFGYHHALGRSLVSPYHVALMSRWPLAEVEDLTPRAGAMQRAAVRATVDVGGERWCFVVLHLSPGHGSFEREALRLRELDDLLPLVAERAMPAVMMGDFNATAPYHKHVRDGVRLEPTDGEVDGTIPREVVRRIVNDGWVDAVHTARPEAMRHSVTTEGPATRVDYIWLTRDLRDRLADAAVEQDGSARQASDHFPVWAHMRRGDG